MAVRVLLSLVLFFGGFYLGSKNVHTEVRFVESRCECSPVTIVDKTAEKMQTAYSKNLDFCLGYIERVTERLEHCGKDLRNNEDALLKVNDEASYWRRKYIDFTCD